MIELLTSNTPNGKKISIMLEEIRFDYKITKRLKNRSKLTSNLSYVNCFSVLWTIFLKYPSKIDKNRHKINII